MYLLVVSAAQTIWQWVIGQIMLMNCTGYGNKWSWTNLRYYPCTCLKEQEYHESLSGVSFQAKF